MNFIEREEGAREGLCTHCGNEATWRYLDEDESMIEVVCPDCGRFEVTREEFDQAESDMPGPEERRE